MSATTAETTPTTAAATAAAAAEGTGAPQLRSGAVSLVEMVGQSLAVVAPTLTPALNITVVAGLAGIGTWFSFLIGTIGVVIAAASVGPRAARHPPAGSYFVYIGRTFGPFTGALAGWAMISAYLFTAISVGLSFTIFLDDFLSAFGFKLSHSTMCAAMIGFVAAVTYAAYRDVKLSSRIGLLLEAVSIVIILGITALIVHNKGTLIDPGQLDVAKFKFGAIFSALPFVIFCFVGFESAATLAKESADPRRNIPIAVIGCAAFSGVFFTLMAYFMIFGMNDDSATIGHSAAPFGDVAIQAGLGWTSVIVYFAAMISVFACCLACMNAASRLMFSMGKYEFLHASLGKVHDTHRTPHRAVLVCGALVVAVSLAMSPLGFLEAFGYAGTLASFGFVVVYLALCIVAPLDLRKTGEMTGRHVLVGILGAALMAFVIVGSVYPQPEYPFNMLPYVFLAFMLVGAIWFGVLKFKSPEILVAIQHDLEG
jgi:amino acid transporter